MRLKYSEGQVIDSGPFGTAYRVMEKQTGIEFTAKIFKCEGTDEYVAPLRWAKEANNLCKFSGDRRFFKLVDKFFEPERKSLALVLEALPGINLETYIERMGLEIVPEDIIWQVVTQTVRGMCRANQNNLMHLNLKPNSIFLVNQEDKNKIDLKLIDVGCANKFNKTCGQFINQYMSPQMLTANKEGKMVADQRDDTWSLGIILFRLMTHSLPFKEIDSIVDLKKEAPYFLLNRGNYSSDLITLV